MTAEINRQQSWRNLTFFPCSLASLPNIRSHCYTSLLPEPLYYGLHSTFIISRPKTYCALRLALNIEAHNMTTLSGSGDVSYGYLLRPGPRPKHSCINQELASGDLTSKRIRGCSYLSVYWNSRSTKTCPVTG